MGVVQIDPSKSGLSKRIRQIKTHLRAWGRWQIFWGKEPDWGREAFISGSCLSYLQIDVT